MSRRRHRPTARRSTRNWQSVISTCRGGDNSTSPRRSTAGPPPGFVEGVNHQKRVRGRFPKSRGIRIGTVVRFDGTAGRGCVVVLDPAEKVVDLVKAGDGVVFDLGRPEEKEPGGRVWAVHEG